VFEADLKSGELRKNGAKVKLEGQPFQILALLLERPGEVVTREELQKKLWPADTFVDFEHSINTAVKRLREALGDSADAPHFIETLPRRGYRFMYPLNGDTSEAPAAAAPVEMASHYRFVAVAGLGAVLLLAALFVFDVGGPRDWLRVWAGPPINSLAVLPLKNVSGDPAQDTFAAGMTDVLITELSRIRALQVRSFQSVQQFKESKKPLAEIARKLNVQAVLEGSFAIEGNRLRLTLQLIRASPETHLWAESYTREMGSALTLQNVLSRDVASELRLKLTPEEKSRLKTEKQVNPKAFDAFVVGRYHLHEGTEEGRRLAGELLQKAVQIDPSFAQAYGQLALLHSHGGGVLAGGGVQTRMQAREWADKAIALDASCAEAYAALGWLELADWDWRGSEQAFRRAIELNPNLKPARTWYSQYLSAMRRFDEAIAQAQRAIEIDPLDSSMVTHAAAAYYEAGRVDEAIAYWLQVVKQDPNYWGAHHYLARAYILKGKYDEAITELQLASQLRNRVDSTPLDKALSAYAHARAGRRAEAVKLVQDIERLRDAGKPFGGAPAMTFAYIAMGDREKAFDALERGFENRGMGMFFIYSEPLYDPLRDDPRFANLVQRIFYPTVQDSAADPAEGKAGKQKSGAKQR
jgi:TolB-like protein/DNA-binding winged helix-turn-helix (wHTH) protein/Tfp pilus assembly protein PilF